MYTLTLRGLQLMNASGRFFAFWLRIASSAWDGVWFVDLSRSRMSTRAVDPHCALVWPKQSGVNVVGGLGSPFGFSGICCFTRRHVRRVDPQAVLRSREAHLRNVTVVPLFVEVFTAVFT